MKVITHKKCYVENRMHMPGDILDYPETECGVPDTEGKRRQRKLPSWVDHVEDEPNPLKKRTRRLPASGE